MSQWVTSGIRNSEKSKRTEKNFYVVRGRVNRIIPVYLILLVVFALNTPVHSMELSRSTKIAPTVTHCESYAASGVNQNNKNIGNSCGYSTAEWHSDYQGHYNWCLGVPAERSQADTDLRANMLAACTSKDLAGNKEQHCANYAASAIYQQAQNISEGCGYASTEWHSDQTGHYDWCLNVDVGRSQSDTDSRSSLLKDCGSDGSNIPPVNETDPNEGDLLPDRNAARIEFVPGQNIEISTADYGDAGGRISINNTHTLLDGVEIDIPAGVFSLNTSITVSHNTGQFHNNTGTEYSPVLDIHIDGQSKGLGYPIEITVPFDKDKQLPVPVYIDTDGEVYPVQISDVDRKKGKLTFQTYHASLFAWIIGLETAYAPDEDVMTGFDPKVDGFHVVNDGSEYGRNGECFGMASFSMWYFLNAKSKEGGLRDRFKNQVGVDWESKPLTGQDIVATRAHLSVSRVFDQYLPELNEFNINKISDEDRFETIKMSLESLGHPIVLYLRNTTDSYHAVLAYGVNDAHGEILIYDPNYPGIERKIIYNKTISKFNDYGRYSDIFPIGSGAFHLSEPYETILEEAKRGFDNSSEIVLQIDSHINGELVVDSEQTITGRVVSSGQFSADEIAIYSGVATWEPNIFRGKIGDDGRFSVPVAVKYGVNHLQFITTGKDTELEDVIIPNTMATVDFHLIGELEKAGQCQGDGWVERESGVTTYLDSLAVSEERIVAISGSRIITSTDGSEWQDVTPADHSVTYKRIIRAGSRFVIVASGSKSGKHYAFLTSDDGVTWSDPYFPGNFSAHLWYPIDIAWDGEKIILVNTVGSIYSSYDSKTWRYEKGISTGVISNGSSYPKRVAYFAGKYIMITADGQIWTASDLQNWNKSEYSGGGLLKDIAYNKGTFVIVGKNIVLTSKNGTDWVKENLSGKPDIQGIDSNGDKFIAVSSTGNIYTSNAGSEWEAIETGVMWERWMDVIWTQVGFISVGSGGKILQGC